jgi:hypothetical protein
MSNPNDETDGGIDPRLKCFSCGEVHERAKIVTTIDGREMGNYQDEWRRYHEAMWVLKKYRSKRTRQAYLSRIAEIRGPQAMADLRAEMMLLWKWKEGQKK